MNDPIEELFRDNQHGLDEKPRDLLWGRIEDRLDEKQVQKKKTEWWKYVAAASFIMGIVTGAWVLMENESIQKPETVTPQIVSEETTEVNAENASDILDKLEEQKQSVVVKEEKKSAPEIIENEGKTAEVQSPLKSPERMEAKVLYDAVHMSAPVPAMEKLKEEENVAYQDIAPEKKQESYILKNKPETADYTLDESRRLGNSAYPEKMELTALPDTLVFACQIWVKTSKGDIVYKISSSGRNSAVFKNAEIPYPSTISVKRENENFEVRYDGNLKKKNAKESKEIQKYINENKNSIFYPIEIE